MKRIALVLATLIAWPALAAEPEPHSKPVVSATPVIQTGVNGVFKRTALDSFVVGTTVLGPTFFNGILDDLERGIYVDEGDAEPFFSWDSSNTRIGLGAGGASAIDTWIERVAADALGFDAPASDPGAGALSSGQWVIWFDDVADEIEIRGKTPAGDNVTLTLGDVSGLDHGADLAGLTDDDHTQYALLAGRSGGTTIVGSPDTAETLILQGNSTDASGGTVRVSGSMVLQHADGTRSVFALREGSGGTDYVGFQAPASITTPVTWTLPAVDGPIGGEALTTDGAGVLSWSGAFGLIAGQVWTGPHDFGGADDLEVPNGAAPTVDTAGQFAFDTTVTDWSTGVPIGYTGEEVGFVVMPIAQYTSPADGNVVAYNATNDEFELIALAALASFEEVGSDPDTDLQPTSANTNGQIVGSNGSAAAPGLALLSGGGKDYGFYKVGSNMGFSAGGTEGGVFTATGIKGGGSGEPEILLQTNASSTVAVFLVRSSDGDTGDGWCGADNPCWVAGGVTALGATELGGGVVLQYNVTSGITASTTQTQGQGALISYINEIATVGSTNDTVTLVSAKIGSCQIVINNGANTLQIFPASGDNLGAGVDTATTLAAGSNIQFCSYDVTNWETI